MYVKDNIYLLVHISVISLFVGPGFLYNNNNNNENLYYFKLGVCTIILLLLGVESMS